MKVLLNNNIEDFPGDAVSVSRLLLIKNFTFKMLVIKLNGKLIQKSEYDTTYLKDGDEIHVLHLISGG
jgi:thiamine biosynthesis protein ThiS